MYDLIAGSLVPDQGVLNWASRTISTQQIFDFGVRDVVNGTGAAAFALYQLATDCGATAFVCNRPRLRADSCALCLSGFGSRTKQNQNRSGGEKGQGGRREKRGKVGEFVD